MNNIARIAKLASEQEGSESARQIIPSTDISSTTSAEIINSVNNNIVSPSVTITTTSNTNVKSNNNDVDNINKEKEVIVLDIMKQKETNNQESQDTFAQLLKATMDKQSEATIGTFLKSNSPNSPPNNTDQIKNASKVDNSSLFPMALSPIDSPVQS